MCAVLDANISGELFAKDRPPIADLFFRWMNRRGLIVVGGEQLDELQRNGNASKWLLQGRLAGNVQEAPLDLVKDKIEELQRRSDLLSNNHHVLAVALVAGARLLFSNDLNLQTDFTNRDIVDPPGRVYTSAPVIQGSGRRAARHPRPLTEGHKILLRRPVCVGCFNLS